MKRFSFLDWMRGFAVVLMIQCHTFNAFTRMDLRSGGSYMLTQFIGGMAAPLFLFMAGMTFGFQMESIERREPRLLKRWEGALRRAGYVWGIAYLFRFTNWAVSWRNWHVEELSKVDILNCMGLAMAAFAVAAMVPTRWRAHFGVAGGLAVAALSPVIANLDWSGAPRLIHEYLAPGFGRGRFPFFPCASYVGFGLAAGTVVKRVSSDRLDRMMQWAAVAGVALIFTALYFSNSPYSIYPVSNFWTDSPALILIRAGVSLMILAAAYLWTEYGAGAGWSGMQAMGKTSLMVYWVHVMLVYGSLMQPLKRALTVWQAAWVTAGVIALMAGMSAAKLWWAARKAAAGKPAAA